MNIVHFSLLNSGSWWLGFLAGFEACPAEPVRPGGSSPRKTELVRPGLEMWQEARQGLAGSLMKMTLLQNISFSEEFTDISGFADGHWWGWAETLHICG